MTIKQSVEMFNPNPANAREAIEQCVMMNRILSHEAVLDAFGHVSVRNPENPNTFFQSVCMLPDMVTRHDILEIDLDGNVLVNDDRKPYAEIRMHGEIYRARPDVNSICHNHAPELIPFSATGIPIRPLTQQSGMFYDGIPLFRHTNLESSFAIQNPDEFVRLANELGSHRAILIRAHGVVIVGENCINTISASVFLPKNAVAQYHALIIGEPQYLTEQEAVASMHDMFVLDSTERMWYYWIRRARDAIFELSW